MVSLGLIYGAVDAIMLSIVPVLSIYGARPGDDLTHSSRIRMAGLALVASVIIAAAYHLGFAEFRSVALIKPLMANLVVTTAYLLSGSPLAPIVAHVILHTTAALHGSGAGGPLPPHY